MKNKIVDQNSTYHDQRKHVLKILHEFCIKNNFKLKIFLDLLKRMIGKMKIYIFKECLKI